jgi:hypothetical protein
MEKIEGMDLEKYMKKRDLRLIYQTLAIEWLKDLLIILAQVHNKTFFIFRRSLFIKLPRWNYSSLRSNAVQRW